MTRTSLTQAWVERRKAFTKAKETDTPMMWAIYLAFLTRQRLDGAIGQFEFELLAGPARRRATSNAA